MPPIDAAFAIYQYSFIGWNSNSWCRVGACWHKRLKRLALCLSRGQCYEERFMTIFSQMSVAARAAEAGFVNITIYRTESKWIMSSYFVEAASTHRPRAKFNASFDKYGPSSSVNMPTEANIVHYIKVEWAADIDNSWTRSHLTSMALIEH